jgi:ABC-type transport system involved in cytochrome bd biosynthesis fused ATPase/permease subunit
MGVTIIMVTHNLEIIAETDRVVRLVNGRIEEPSEPMSPYSTLGADAMQV